MEFKASAADLPEVVAELPDLADVAVPAPGASPEHAFAYLAGPDGVEAWLVAGEPGEDPTGYLRDAEAPEQAVEIDDAQAWAQIVDHLGLTEQDPAEVVREDAEDAPAEDAEDAEEPPAEDTEEPPAEDAEEPETKAAPRPSPARKDELADRRDGSTGTKPTAKPARAGAGKPKTTNTAPPKSAEFEALHPRGAGGRFTYKNDSGSGAIRSGTKDKVTKDGQVTGRISEAQQALVKAGLLDPKAGRNGKAVDGYFGPKTARAVLDYQKQNKLPVTGKLDAATMGKLGVGKTKPTPKAKAPMKTGSSVAGVVAAAKKAPKGTKGILPDGFEAKAASNDGEPHTGIMVAFVLDEADAAALVLTPSQAKAPLDADDLHLTLAFLGEVDDVEDQGEYAQTVLEVLHEVADRTAAVTGQVSGVGRFTDDDTGDPFYLSFDSPTIADLRHRLVEELGEADIDVDTTHGFTPHITLAYLGESEPQPLRRVPTRTLTFDRIVFAFGDARIEVPLTGGHAADEDDAAAAGDALMAFAKHPESTSPTMFGEKGNPFGKNAEPKAIAAGDWVSWPGGKGKVDLVVSNGTVPGIDRDVEGSKSEPVARVAVYKQAAGGGKWAATGEKVAVKVSGLKRQPAFMFTGGGKKGSAAETLVAMLADHQAAAREDGTPLSEATAVRTVYGRGLQSWPGDTSGTTREDWALGRTKAFLASVEGREVPGYVSDRDLFPAGHPLAVKRLLSVRRDADGSVHTHVVEAADLDAVLRSLRDA